MKDSLIVLFLAWAVVATAAEPPSPQPRITYKPVADSYYPRASRIKNEEGMVDIRICFDEKGRITGTEIQRSSGSQQLDKAALHMGRMYRIKPGVIDGKPRPGCLTVPVKFSVKSGSTASSGK